MLLRPCKALLALIALAAMPSMAHAIELQPGTWQETETGTEDGKAVPAKTETHCMTPEDAKDPLKGFSPEKDMKELQLIKQQCKTLEAKKSDTGLTIRVQCGDTKQFGMNVGVDYTFTSPRSYSGTVKSAVTLMGKTMTTDKKVEGKWLSATCEQKPARRPRG